MPKEQIPQTLAILCDPNASDEQKLEACSTIEALHSNVDRRRVVPVLIKLLDSDNEHLRLSGCQILGYLCAERSIEPLLKVATNKSEQTYIRGEAIRALSYADDESITAGLQTIMFDTTENIEVRSLVIEWLSRSEGMLNSWIRLLSDELPDIRFWAAYRLSQMWSDITPALSTLDQIAAYDHTLPQLWGWHVDREALEPLEIIYARPYRIKEFGEDNRSHYGMWLVSPAPEYITFSREYWHYEKDGFSFPLPVPDVTLRVDPDWLKAEILQAFPQVTFNARQPKPQTYLLDWHLRIDGQNLLGGLHRDQYALVLNGKTETVHSFAAWYRNITESKHRLFLYNWADIGLELMQGITAIDIQKAVGHLYSERTSVAKPASTP